MNPVVANCNKKKWLELSGSNTINFVHDQFRRDDMLILLALSGILHPFVGHLATVSIERLEIKEALLFGFGNCSH